MIGRATALLLLAACGGSATLGVTGTSTGDASSGGPETTGSTTAADSSTGAIDGSSSEGGPMLPPGKSCALEVIDPRADPTAVIDAGPGDTQLPTVIGEALLRNCGCHYTDDVAVGQYIDYQSNAVPLATLADFHADFAGTFPVGFEGMPTYLAVQARVVDHQPLPMPPLGCGVEGEPGLISAADLQLFTQWLAAAAPSGAAFP